MWSLVIGLGMARRCCCLGGVARADGGGNDRKDRTRHDMFVRSVARLETELRVSTSRNLFNIKSAVNVNYFLRRPKIAAALLNP